MRRSRRAARRRRAATVLVVLAGMVLLASSAAYAEGPVDSGPGAHLFGKKYFDTNLNGRFDAGEPGIANWPINLTFGTTTITILTDSNGNFTTPYISPGTYVLAEQVALAPWIQTGNIVDQTFAAAGQTAAPGIALNSKIYSVTLPADEVSNTAGFYFGNVCVGAGNGRTPGFWQSRNGQALFGSDDLALMVSLNLRNADGSNFDPTSYAQFKEWLKSRSSTNMAYQLSANLAAAELNILNGFLTGNEIIFAPGTASADAFGFATLNAIRAEADAALGADGSTPSGDPNRPLQTALKDALERANTNKNFLQPDHLHCPAPTFPHH